MSNLTGGQIAGGVVGGIIGFFAGGGIGAARGVAIGLALGGYVDPPQGPVIRGPTLDDNSFQSANYGVTLPRLYGRVGVYGDVIYLENNKYKAVDSSQRRGGKGGGGGQKVVTTTYYATFAVALGQAYPGAKPYRVWAGGKLIIGGTLTGTKKVKGKTKKLFDYRFYDGTQTAPDPRMESVLDIGYCPSYEGTTYIMFYDFDLTEYGNGLSGCPIKVEFYEPDADGSDSIINYTLQEEENFSFPENISHLFGCSMAIHANNQYAVWSVNESGSRYFHRFGQIGLVESFDGIAAAPPRAIFTHTNNEQSNRILWSVEISQHSPIVGTVLYTNIGQFTNPYVYEPLPWIPFCTLMAILSVEGINYSIYQVNGNADSSFGLPIGDFFLTILGGSQQILSLGNLETFQSVNFAISAGKFYLLTGFYNTTTLITEWNLSIYRLSDGALLSINPIDIPTTVENQGTSVYRYAAEIYNGKFYFGGMEYIINGLFIITIDLTTFVSEAKRFQNMAGTPIELGNDGQISIYNGVIAFFVHRQEGPRTGAKIYRFATPVIDYDNPQSRRIPITQIIERELNAVDLQPADYDLNDIASDTTVGFKVSEVAAARAAIGPIQSAYLFDMIERGYQLAAVKRGKASAGVIYFRNLVIVGDAAVKSDVDSNVLMPSLLTLNYIDWDREFETGSQNAPYPAKFASVQSKDLPVVMQANEAARLADMFIRSMHFEARKYEFSLPHPYMDIEVGEIYTVEVYPGKFVDLRIDSRNFAESGLLTFNCTATSAATYTSAAVGDSGETPSEIFIPSFADPIPLVLDVPLMREEQDVFGIAATVIQAPPTTQSALLVSPNDGISFNEIGRFNGAGVVGQSSFDVLGDGDPFVTERDTDLHIDNMITGEFFSVTYEEMLRNNNLIAYGQPGRWEILSYQDATPTGVGSNVILSTFIRGKYGTEQYMSGHTSADLIVLLDHPNTIFAAMPAQSVGLSWPIKAVNVGDDTDGGVLANYGTYDAVNLKPLSVVNPEVNLIGADWQINFDPRTRYPSNQWVTGNLEQTDTQFYSVVVFNGTAIARTIQSTTIPIIYTEAQQIADFGAPQSNLTIDIYQVNQRVGRGYPLRVTT